MINTTSQKEKGDSKDMAVRRTAFLDSGKYEPFRDAILRATDAAATRSVVVDAGCGEGYYTTALCNDFSYVYGFDLSKASIDRAAKRAKELLLTDRCFFGVGSVYDIPIKDETADCVVNIFAPIVEKEYTRILKKDGILVIGCAGPKHLWGLKDILYDKTSLNTERADLPKDMELISKEQVCYEFEVSGENIKNLYMMTPYAHKTSRQAEERLFSHNALKATADFLILTYKKTTP